MTLNKKIIITTLILTIALFLIGWLWAPHFLIFITNLFDYTAFITHSIGGQFKFSLAIAFSLAVCAPLALLTCYIPARKTGTIVSIPEFTVVLFFIVISTGAGIIFRLSTITERPLLEGVNSAIAIEQLRPFIWSLGANMLMSIVLMLILWKKFQQR